MFVDYYAVLGVAPDATLDQIKTAYRAAAFQNHPDHGGSHKKMSLVNEAWEILSDQSRRAEYDRVRSYGSEDAARSAWTQATEEVRRRAEDYPQQWGDFEKWMDRFIADVKSASYGSEDVPGIIIKVPTIGGSESGSFFMYLGASIAGMLCWQYGLYDPLLDAWSRHDWGRALFLTVKFAILPLVAGAWIGRAVHQALGNVLKKYATPKPEGSVSTGASDTHAVKGLAEQELLRCPSCRQRLRVPKQTKELLVTCPSCKTSFTHRPST